MMRRGFGLSLALLVFGAAAAHPQGVVIDHKEVGCIVVGKYPKMNACFSPAADLARSRVYFRPEGVTSWYYVDMKSDQPCFSGTLPKPGKKLVGKHVEYYLEAQNKAFVPSRTAEYAPIVVRSAQECKKEVPVAPFLNNATVAVFPSVPAGFVGSGGIGTAAVVGIVGAGAAAATTTAIVVSNNNNDTTTTTIASSVNTTTTLAAVTTTTTTTTPPTGVNKPPNAVLKTIPDPPQGLGPLTVTFDMCASSDPEGAPLSFFFTFGDGSTASGSCIQTHTYAASFRSTTRDVTALDSTYTFEGSVVDPGGLSQTRTRTVIAQLPPPPTTVTTTTTTTLPCGTPSVTINAPADGSCIVVPPPGGGIVRVDVTASDPTGIFQVVGRDVPTDCVTGVDGTPPDDSGPMAFTPPNQYTRVYKVNPPVSTPRCLHIYADATNNCGNVGSNGNSVKITIAPRQCVPFPAVREEREAVAWASDLDVQGGRLQVVFNGADLSYPERGRGQGTAAVKDGENRVEATLVNGDGRAGLWRFEFVGSRNMEAGSIRVLSGEVSSVAATSVTFRLTGTPGERVAFTFVRSR